jgi:hypothetical protein
MAGRWRACRIVTRLFEKADHKNYLHGTQAFPSVGSQLFNKQGVG